MHFCNQCYDVTISALIENPGLLSRIIESDRNIVKAKSNRFPIKITMKQMNTQYISHDCKRDKNYIRGIFYKKHAFEN